MLILKPNHETLHINWPSIHLWTFVIPCIIAGRNVLFATTSHITILMICASPRKKSSQQIPCALSPQTMLFTLDKMLSYSKGKIRLLLHNLEIFLRTASKWALGKACKYNLLILFLSQLAFFTTQNTLKHWKQPPNPVANSYSWTFWGGPQKP